ncbi:MAG: ABC-F family ATP-binding cassette domain-containing protein [Firmicutes bacterium]|uniref:ABC-F family ATP-binding cassette domain-containing protein n=1 Tax=Candidatus Gallilactobacillus intestinavium TaxID=2840838 RepID=A0A9D9H8F6_9LACO|nr:ABC-F family ATP-binding cassette domain-containing protein [Candidatus Gallilactobacillus intestinavium]
MNLIQINNLTKEFNGKTLFKNVNLTISDKNKYALIGQNGAGKSTLIKIILGIESSTAGKVITNNQIKIGYLPQNPNFNSQKTVWDEMLDAVQDLVSEEKEINRLEKVIAQGSENPDYQKALNKYDYLQNDFLNKNGYAYSSNIRSMLHIFHFKQEDYNRKVNSFSGGQKTQLAFIKLLLQNPDLLILDEPTNHLDIDTLVWLEDYLTNYSGAVLIVSHDRFFLDKVVDNIYDLRNKTISFYKGNYSSYLQQYDQRLQTQIKQYNKQQKEINKLQTFINKNIVRSSTSKQAQARRKKLEKMEVIQAPQTKNRQMHISFSPNEDSGKEVLKVENLSIGYNNQILANNINFLIKKQHIVGIIGPNGIGKSTLLKTIMHSINPLNGSIKLGANVSIGYYDQEQLNLNNKKTVLNEVWDDHPLMPETDIRNILGSFLFSGDDVKKYVSELSGGEKARLSLTKLSLNHDNFLILDEPTNHLDIDARQILENTLVNFSGTILFVSHDRYFINQIATDIIEINNNSAKFYPGNYNDYLIEKEKELNNSNNKNSKEHNYKTNKENKPIDKEKQREIRKIKRQIDQKEKIINEATKIKKNIESQMQNPQFSSDVKKLTDLQTKLNEQTKIIDENENEWLDLSNKLEQLNLNN